MSCRSVSYWQHTEENMAEKNPWLHQITLDVHMTIYCPSPLSFDLVPVTKSSDTQDTENTRLFEKKLQQLFPRTVPSEDCLRAWRPLQAWNSDTPVRHLQKWCYCAPWNLDTYKSSYKSYNKAKSHRVLQLGHHLTVQNWRHTMTPLGHTPLMSR